MLSLIVSFLALLFLVFLHEIFHFIFAKKYHIPVEELALGLPPRIWKKKIKETVYSIGLFPLGGFVKINEKIFKKASFKARAWTILAGCFSFWIIAYFLFSFNALIGLPVSADGFSHNQEQKTFIIISGIAENSPAKRAGLKIGDKIIAVKTDKEDFEIKKIAQFQELMEKYQGKEITIEILRGKELLFISATPRISPPENEGRLGIAMEEIFIKKSPFIINFWDGAVYTIKYTLVIFQTYLQMFWDIFQREKTISLSLVGPIGFVHFSSMIFSVGFNYFLNFLGTVAISLSFFNLLPIPVTDGGRFLMVLIEKIRKKQFSLETEERIIGLCFIVLILAAIIISIKDLQRIF